MWIERSLPVDGQMILCIFLERVRITPVWRSYSDLRRIIQGKICADVELLSIAALKFIAF